MKYISSILLLLLLSLLLAVSGTFKVSNNSTKKNPTTSLPAYRAETIIDESIPSYDFNISFDHEQRRLSVVQKIILANTKTKRLYIALPVNAFERQSTAYNAGREVDKRSFCRFEFDEIRLNDELVNLNYIPHNIFKEDRTLASLPILLQNSDPIEITFSYKINLPVNADMFGYSKGNNLCMLTYWYPYVVSDTSQLQHRTRFITPKHGLADIHTKLQVPSDITVVGSGIQKQGSEEATLQFFQKNTEAVAFAFMQDVTELNWIYESSEKNVSLQILMLEQYERYTDRIKIAVSNSLKYLEENLAPYPFHQLSIVNVPNKTNFGFGAFGKIATVYCDLISPLGTMNPEHDLIRMIVKQYFQQLNLSVNYDRWITEGLVTFITAQILKQYYEKPNVYFHFAGYYPVYGLNFLSYNSIPIIYTLKDFRYDAIFRNISTFYENINSNPVINSHIEDFSERQYFAVHNVKTALMLESLSREIGVDRLVNSIRNTYAYRKYEESFTHSFLANLDSAVESDIWKFIYTGLADNLIYDYSIDVIEEIGEFNYRIDLSRIGNGKDDVELSVYTENDSSKIFWSGESNKKSFMVNSKSRITSAKIKLKYADLLDINKANNSYILKPNYWGPFAISLRTFFWFQNALMIFGSIG